MKLFKKIKILRRKAFIIILPFVVIVLPVTIYILTHTNNQASAAWFNENWLYRKAITVTVTSNSSDLTDLETLVTVDTSASGKFQSSCQDLRFTSTSGNLLPYYIDSGCTTASTKVWVMIDLVPKNTTTYTMYLYYGNPSAPAASDSSKFRLFNGLVGYWAMNETSWNGTSGEVKDNSVSGNNGISTCYGGGCTVATTTTGKYGNGGNFDGNSAHGYVSISSAPANGNNDYTFSAWIKPNNFGASNTIISEFDNPGGSSNVLIRFMTTTTSKLWCGTYNNGYSAVASNTSLSAGQWVHVVCTKSGTTGSLYINGVLDNTGTLGNVTVTDTRIGAGENVSPPYIMNGTIDDTRIYNRALSASEISQLYNNPGNIASNVNATVKPTTSAGSEEQGPGPVGYWKFDDGQGVTAQDSSSSNNDGTLTGTTLPVWTEEAGCVSGKCIQFDGVDDYVDITRTIQFDSNNFSISGWFRTGGDTSSSYDQIWNSGYGGSNPDVEVVMSANKLVFYARDSSGTATTGLTSNNALNDNKWHFFSATRSGNTFTLYADGIQQSSGTFALGDVDTAGVIPRIGNGLNNINNRQFPGFIDDVKIYPYARSVAQIRADFNSGSSRIGTSAKIGSPDLRKSLSDGLVGYWRLDEASGNAVDASGNGNTGTWYGSGSHYASGKFGNGGSINGTNDFIQTGNSSSLNIAGGNATFTAWFKANTLSGYDTIFEYGNGGGGYYFGLVNGSPNVIFYGSTNHIHNSATVLSTGVWHQMVATWDAASKTTKVYFDGVLDSTVTTSNAVPNTNTTSLRIGARDTNSLEFDGTLDEARIYNRALSPKEVADLYNFAPGPVLHLKMDEGVNGDSKTLTDSSGFGNNGTTVDGANNTGMDCNKPGKYGKACSFDGTDDYVSVADNSAINLTTSFSLSMWIKPTTVTPSYQILLDRRTGSNTGYTIMLNTNKILFGFDSYWHTATAYALSPNTWYYVEAVYDNATSTAKVYINGTQQLSEAETHTPVSRTIALRLGVEAYDTNTSWYTGLIDDVKIYNYARTPAQIQEDLQAGRQKQPIAYYKLDEGQGTVANNSGNGGSTLNGTLTSMSSPATATSGWTNSGKFGKGLIFDGTDDYVNAGDRAVFDFGTNDFTLEAWIRWDGILGAGNVGRIISKQNTANNQYYMLWKFTDDKFGMRVLPSGGAIIDTNDSVALTPGVFYHITGVRNGTNLYLYKNGVLVGTNTISASASISPSDRALAIGNYIVPAANNAWNGIIDEPKVYNYALTADEVKLEYNQGSSLVLGTLGNLSSLSNQAAGQEYCIPGDSSTCTAPVAEWNFEEGKDNTCSGGVNDVCDSSGNANDGAWNGTGSKHWDTGKIGKGGRFVSTTSDGISFSGTLYDMTQQTLSAWVKTTDTRGYVSTDYKVPYNALLSSNINAANQAAFWTLGVVSEKLVGVIDYTTASDNPALITQGVTTINDGKWHHAEWTIDKANNSSKLYIDGKLDVSASLTNFTSMSENFKYIGMNNMWGGNQYFNGSIDQVRIFNYARTPAQIAWDYNRGKPVAYWDFDECQGTTLGDLSGNGNTGTITIGASGEDTLGTCTTSSTAWGSGATGKRNASLSFDGTDDYVSVGSPALLDDLYNGKSFTLSAWVKPNSSSNFTRILDKRVNDNFGWSFYYKSSGNIGFHSPPLGLNQFETTTNAITNDNWHHLVAVYDDSADTLTLYINGVNHRSTSTALAFSSDAANNLIIGARADGGGLFFKGQIDDVKIFNYALTASQVKDVYNQGSAVRFGPATGSP